MPCGSQPPRLYGLPKVHKPNVPLRPVIDMSTSAYHATAQWIAEILEPVRKSLAKYSVKDSFSFVEMIKHQDLSERTMLP